MWGWLFGSAFLFIPIIGPLLFAEPILIWMLGAVEGTSAIKGLLTHQVIGAYKLFGFSFFIASMNEQLGDGDVTLNIG